MSYWRLGIEHVNLGGRYKIVFLHQKTQEDKIYLKVYHWISSLLIWLLHLIFFLILIFYCWHYYLVFIFLYCPSVLSCPRPSLRNLFSFHSNYLLQGLCCFICFSPLLISTFHCVYLLLLLLFKRRVNISLNQCLSTIEMKYPSESQDYKIGSDNLFLIIGKIPNSTNDLLFKNKYFSINS